MLKLDDYLQQKTGTLHVSENAFELGDYTALGKFDDLATARRAIESMRKSSADAQVTLAQSALESMSSTASMCTPGSVTIARSTMHPFPPQASSTLLSVREIKFMRRGSRTLWAPAAQHLSRCSIAPTRPTLRSEKRFAV